MHDQIFKKLQPVSLFVSISLLFVALVFSWTGAASASQNIAGVLAASSGQVERRHEGQTDFEPLVAGDKIYLNDEIQTGNDGRIQILLMDETTFSIGADSAIVIDDFIYNPTLQEGSVDVEIKTGVFRFISGRIAKKNPQNMKVMAGNAVISIRGTEVIGTVEDGKSQIVLLSGAIDIVANTDICQGGGAGCTQSVTRPGFGVSLNDAGKVTTPTRIDAEDISTVIDSLDSKPKEEEEEQEEQPSETETEEEQDRNTEEDEASVEENTAVEEETEEAQTQQEEKPEEEQVQEEPEELQLAESPSEETNEQDNTLQETERPEEVIETTEIPEEKKEEVSGFDLIVLRSLGLAEDKAAEEVKAFEANIIEDTKPEDTKESTEEFDEKPEEQVESKIEDDLEKLEDDKINSANEEKEETREPENNSPVLARLNSINFNDTKNDDTFAENTDETSARDADGDTLTFSVEGMSADTSRSGYTHSVSGEYGILYFDQSSGKYVYLPDDDKIEGLKANTSESFTVSVSDSEDTDTQTLLVSINSNNDTPELANVTAISLSDTARDDSFNTTSAELSASDRDDTSFSFEMTDMQADTSQTGYTHSVSGDYGIMYLNEETGAYTYIPDDAAIEGLKTTERDQFTFTVSDGEETASQTLTATISGANDTPTLSALTAISFTDTSADNTFSAETGSSSASDRDADTLTYSAADMQTDTSRSGYSHSVSGTYGTLFINSTTGDYTYVPDDAAIEALKTDEADTFTLTVSDGEETASQTLTASISGANDTPVLSTLAAISFTDTSTDNTFTAETGTTSASDRDADTLTYSAADMQADTSQSGYTHAVSGDYGTLYLNSSTGSYTYVPNDAAIEALKTSETDTFTISASDGEASATQTLTASIQGANDTPTFSALTTINFTDTSADNTFSAETGSTSAADRDADTLTYTVTDMSADTSRSGYTHSVSGDYGRLFINSNSGAYIYVPNDASIEALKTSETDTFTFITSDGSDSVSQTLTASITGANDTPSFETLAGISFTDTAANNTFNAVTGTSSASDRDSDTLSFSVSEMTADTAQSGYTHSVSGDYGTLYLNSSSGAYTYIPDDNAIEGLKTSETDTFTLTASDGSASTNQTLTASITGANDTPTLASFAEIAFTDTSADNTFMAETGTSSGSDRDADTLTYSITDMVANTTRSGYTHSVAGDYGTLFINENSGAYIYVPDDGAIEALKTTETDTFTVTASDGSASASQTLTASITGANDTPTLSALTSISFTDTASDNTFTAQTGSTSASDRDADTLTYSAADMQADTSQSGYTHAVSGDYGTLYLNSSSGAYTYIPDDDAIEGLKTSETDTFTVTASDGTSSASQTLTANIAGANDTPTLSALSAISFTDTSADNTFTPETGSTSAADRDADTLTYSVTDMAADDSRSGYTHSVSGDYGTFFINSTSGAYTYVPDDTAIEALKTTETDTFTVTASDGSASASQTLTASITGANDTPTLASLAALSFTDTAADNTFTAETGSTSAADRDADTLTYTVTDMTANTSRSGYTHSKSGDYGTLYINNNSGAYIYVPDDAAIEGLKTSETDTFTITASDGSASASQTLTASITGANDTPTLASLAAIAFTDTAADNTFSAVTGTPAASDRDADTLSFSVTDMTADTSQSGYTHAVSGDYGTLYLNSTSGAYTYIPDDTAIEGLKTSQSETFTLTASDGSASVSETLTANITGANDTPTLAALAGISFTDTSSDDSFSASSATVTAADRDSDTLSFSVTDMVADTTQSGYTHAITGDYGTLYINSGSGAYTYLPGDAAIEGLKTTETDTFTLVASDGAATASQTLTATLTGTNDTPTLADLSTLSFVDTANDDTFSTSTGAAQGDDRDTGDTLTYGLDGSKTTNVAGFTHVKQGSYGAFYINSSSGSYQYIPNDSAIESLTDSANEVFEVTVTDADGSVTEGDITVSITGANDTPTLASLAAIAYSDTSSDDTFTSSSGRAQGTDRDVSENLSYTIQSGTTSTLSNYNTMLAGDYGTLHINETTGEYRYVPEDSSIEAIKSDVTEDFTVVVSDDGGASASGTVTVNISGVDDSAVLNISSATIPSSVAYTETSITSDNLLSNPTFDGYGSGWTKVGNVCSSASATSNTCSRIDDGKFYAGPQTGGLSQTINPVEILGLSDAQAAKGGTLSWSTEVRLHSNFCMGGSTSDACNDSVTVEVTGKDANGQTIVDDKETRTDHVSWQTWNKQEAVEDAPVEVTYTFSGKDYTYWGCTADQNICNYGPRIRNPSVTYSYAVDDDVVVSILDATDRDDSGDLTYSLVSDSSSGIFEVRGNQLILVGGSTVGSAGDDVYDLVIGITNANGVTVNADVSVSVSDARNVAQQISQQINSDEGSEYSLTTDFGQGTVASDDLPSWLSLVDSGNGRAVISGTAPNSGEVSFSVYSIENGEKTTSNYVLTVGEACTSAYCEDFVSSTDTQNLASYSYDGQDHTIGTTKYYHFNSWDDLHRALSTGTGVFERTGISLDANDGTWEGNLRLSIDFANRNIDSTAWGTFSGYNGGNSGSFRMEDSEVFAKSNSNCSTSGDCTIFTSPSLQKTCTGSTCNSGATSHSNVNLTATGRALLLQNESTSYGMVGGLQLNDTSNSNALAAETAGNGVLLESQ